jgi:hypothetical protein
MQGLLLSRHAAKVYGLVAMMLVLWFGGFFDKQAKLVRIYATQGVIETVYERAYLIRLQDGRKARIQRDVELTKGTAVDLKISVYADQSEKAVLVGKVKKTEKP